MRDLKFRAYDNIRGKWLLGFDYGRRGFSIDGEMMAFGEWSNVVCEMVRGDFGKRGEGLIVQQFTGVKDIDDIDIYEGDLVEFVFAVQTNKETGKKQGLKDSFGVYEVFYKERAGAFYLKVHKKNWLDTFFQTEEDARKNTIDPNCPPITITEQPLLKFGVCRVIGNIFDNKDLLK